MSLNAICPYYTMFPEEFPRRHIARRRSGWVLDPFCGRGTTGFVARTLGLPSVSVDVSPVAVAIARAKLVQTTPEAIKRRAASLLSRTVNVQVPTGEFWERAYHPDVLDGLARLRMILADASNAEDIALRAILLGALHGPLGKAKQSYLSNQMPRTFAPKPGYSVRYWKRHRLRAPAVDIVSVVAERAARYFDAPLPATEGWVVHGDARDFSDPGIRFRTILTSPPYVGMTTYVPDQWLRNWFVGGPSEVDYAAGSQLGRGGVEAFTSSLAAVWKRVAQFAEDRAALVIRLGAIRSVKCDPREVARASLAEADAGWRVRYIGDAGAANGSARQANHMGKVAAKSAAVKEIDVVATLEH